MTTKHIKITDDAKKELSEARIEGDILYLRPNIKKYNELKTIFETIGVVWRKKEKYHVLGLGAKEAIDNILNGGKIEDVEAGEFSKSGTEIATMIVPINK